MKNEIELRDQRHLSPALSPIVPMAERECWRRGKLLAGVCSAGARPLWYTLTLLGLLVSLPAGAQMVLGRHPADTATTNFWEQNLNISNLVKVLNRHPELTLSNTVGGVGGTNGTAVAQGANTSLATNGNVVTVSVPSFPAANLTGAVPLSVLPAPVALNAFTNNLIPPDATLSVGIGPLGENAYQLPFNLTNGVIYLVVGSVDVSGDALETSDASLQYPALQYNVGFLVPRMGLFTNDVSDSQPWFVVDSYNGTSVGGEPVHLKLYVYGTNGISTNATVAGTFVGDFFGRLFGSITNLYDLSTTVSNLTVGIYTGIQQPSGIGSVLIPQLLAGSSPTTLFITGDSMADGGFNSTLYYLTTLLRYEYGNAGSYCLPLDSAYNGTPTTRFNNWPTISPKYLTTARGGATIYASDGTNSTRASQTGGGINIPINAMGFWYWAQSNGGNFVANYTNSAGNGTITLSGYSAKAQLLHTNIPIALGTNGVIYFTSLVGTNYIVGWDNVNTNSAGIADMIWAHGGYELYNVISLTNLGTNSFNTIFSVVKPSLVLLDARNNGIEGMSSLSNQLYRLAQVAITNNSGCSIVTVSPPSAPGAGPASSTAWESLAGAMLPSRGDSPFYNIRLNYIYNNISAITAQALGFNPHPTALGGELSAEEVYRQLGFMRPPGSYNLFNATSNALFTLPQGYLGTPASRGDVNVAIANLLATNGNGSALTSLTGANVTGTVPNATTAVNFTGSLTGDVSGTQGATALAATGTAGTYTKVTTDAKGRVTSGTTLVGSDITAALNALGLYPRPYSANGNAAAILGSARFWPLFGGVGQTAANNGLANQPAGSTTIHSNWNWQINFVTAPANNLTNIVVVYKNDLPTSVTAKIITDGTSTNFTCSDLVHTLSTVPGDKVAMQVTNPTATSMSPGVSWYWNAY